jgi:cbb3-type cytochrome oxidase subunit 1
MYLAGACMMAVNLYKTVNGPTAAQPPAAPAAR